MKQIVLCFIIFFFTFSVQAHVGPLSSDSPNTKEPTISFFEDDYHKITIFPNPATEFISIANDLNVKEVSIFNLVGRKMKTLDAVIGERYDVSNLPNGMYLVQLRDENLKVITTQRISKR